MIYDPVTPPHHYSGKLPVAVYVRVFISIYRVLCFSAWRLFSFCFFVVLYELPAAGPIPGTTDVRTIYELPAVGPIRLMYVLYELPAAGPIRFS